MNGVYPNLANGNGSNSAMNIGSSGAGNSNGYHDYRRELERPKLTSTSSSSSIRSTSSLAAEYWGYFTNSISGLASGVVSGTGSASTTINSEINGSQTSVGGTRSVARDEPSRQHWKPDSSRFNCANCKRVFHYMTETRRKHHCRHCGDVFCSDCLKNYVYLDKDAKFTMFTNDDDQTQQNSGDREQSDLVAATAAVSIGSGSGSGYGYGRSGSQSGSGSSSSRSNSSGLYQHQQQENTNTEKKSYFCKVCLSCSKKYEKFVRSQTASLYDAADASNASSATATGGSSGKTAVSAGGRGRTDGGGSGSGSYGGGNWDWSSF
ncbi:unnamed protein product [Ambrosiozyma monospora]|uniref:Unnamed protein product n=1 Tax=Ambrosiozyma monospora TaxID=43982 RepID=A0ACB5TD01_AMBMO|nr:unnamed protein product [Ambrosiozyma monospora]